MIAGYLGEGEAFDEAIADFAMAYANQTGRDFVLWQEAIRRGQIEVET